MYVPYFKCAPLPNRSFNQRKKTTVFLKNDHLPEAYVRALKCAIMMCYNWCYTRMTGSKWDGSPYTSITNAGMNDVFN